MDTQAQTGTPENQTPQAPGTPENEAPQVVSEVEGTKALLSRIEVTFQLLQEGTFPGHRSSQLVQVLSWLERFHKSVEARLPKAPVEV